MRILVCSDSHGDLVALRQIYLANPGLDLYLHCGDICLPDYAVREFTIVKGNCDYFSFPLKRDIPTKWGNIHMEHGNSYQARKKEYIESLHCFIYLFGHTHVKEHGYDGKTWVFNPGSLTEPEDSAEGSYLLIDIDEESGKLTYRYVDFPL
ncbi:MAG: YfcE family phosphodiesterase [Bacilli bacterium]|jgi:putative phosphoesterase|nr:YfcE family phosphodiesterase [Bacilli bacterium]